MSGKLGAAALLLTLAIALKTPGVVRVEAGSSAFANASADRRSLGGGWLDPAVQKTTKDKLYSKEQATRGGELYVKYCEKCHTPEKVPEGKKPGPAISGPKFLEAWADRTVGELFATIRDTMPSDGAVTLTPDQVLDAVAHILQTNGFPDGPAPLKNDDAMKTAVIVK